MLAMFEEFSKFLADFCYQDKNFKYIINDFVSEIDRKYVYYLKYDTYVRSIISHFN